MLPVETAERRAGCTGPSQHAPPGRTSPLVPREGVVLPGPTCTLLASRRPADNPRGQEGGALASLSTEGQCLPYGQCEHPVWGACKDVGAPVNVAGRVLCTLKPSHKGRAGLGCQELVARQPHGSPTAQCCRREASPPPCHRAATTWASGREGAACWASCELRVFIPGWGGPSPSMCPGSFPGAPQSQPQGRRSSASPGGPVRGPCRLLLTLSPYPLRAGPRPHRLVGRQPPCTVRAHRRPCGGQAVHPQPGRTAASEACLRPRRRSSPASCPCRLSRAHHQAQGAGSR